MSNIGRLPIKVPSDIKINFIDNNANLVVKGPFGSLTTKSIDGISYKYIKESQQIKIELKKLKTEKKLGISPYFTC